MKFKKYKWSTFNTEDSDDIIFTEYNSSIKVDLSVAQELVANRLEFTENRSHYIIINVSNAKEVTHEAKVYMQNPEAGLKNILGAAFLASNPVSALFANIFIKTRKSFPANFFSNRKDALKWIKELKASFKA
ncbi:MAG TPA: hypothetical protein VFM99_07245 [Chitinophagales bacterium]|nr:hypothetical protein [Chitinophagales bacterium]